MENDRTTSEYLAGSVDLATHNRTSQALNLEGKP